VSQSRLFEPIRPIEPDGTARSAWYEGTATLAQGDHEIAIQCAIEILGELRIDDREFTVTRPWQGQWSDPHPNRRLRLGQATITLSDGRSGPVIVHSLHRGTCTFEHGLLRGTGAFPR